MPDTLYICSVSLPLMWIKEREICLRLIINNSIPQIFIECLCGLVGAVLATGI